MSDDEQFLQGVKIYFSNAFEMTNTNLIEFCFKIQVSKNITNHSLHLSQKNYSCICSQTFWDVKL
jgi:hypothetical protein